MVDNEIVAVLTPGASIPEIESKTDNGSPKENSAVGNKQASAATTTTKEKSTICVPPQAVD